jgi:hypothetical protein
VRIKDFADNAHVIPYSSDVAKLENTETIVIGLQLTAKKLLQVEAQNAQILEQQGQILRLLKAKGRQQPTQGGIVAKSDMPPR